MSHSLEVSKQLALAKIELDYLTSLITEMKKTYGKKIGEGIIDQFEGVLEGFQEKHAALNRNFKKLSSVIVLDRQKKLDAMMKQCGTLREAIFFFNADFIKQIEEPLKPTLNAKKKMVQLALSQAVTFKDNIKTLSDTQKIEHYVGSRGADRDFSEMTKLKTSLKSAQEKLKVMKFEFNNDFITIQGEVANTLRGEKIGKDLKKVDADRKRLTEVAADYSKQLTGLQQKIIDTCKLLIPNYDKIKADCEGMNNLAKHATTPIKFFATEKSAGEKINRDADLSEKELEEIRAKHLPKKK